MKTIPIELLKKFQQEKTGANFVRTYTDRNPLVRWLYWNRLEKMLKLGKECTGNKILDLGCGDGVFLTALSANFKLVYGIDLDISAAKKVVSYYKLDNVSLFQKEFFDNSFNDSFFDIIFAASVLEHFEDRDRMFSEIIRILAPNGYLIFSSPTETGFYEIGRKVFGYRKPDDHYHTDREIADAGRKYLKLIDKKYGPIPKLSIIAAYCIYVLKNE